MLERDAASSTGGFKLTETTGWSDVYYRTNFYKVATAEMLRVISIPRGDEEDTVQGNKEFRKYCQENPNLDRFFLYEAYKAILRKKPKGQSTRPEASSSIDAAQRDTAISGSSPSQPSAGAEASSMAQEQTIGTSDAHRHSNNQYPQSASDPEASRTSGSEEQSRREYSLKGKTMTALADENAGEIKLSDILSGGSLD